jgi:hypothetical protein
MLQCAQEGVIKVASAESRVVRIERRGFFEDPKRVEIKTLEFLTVKKLEGGGYHFDLPNGMFCIEPEANTIFQEFINGTWTSLRL